MNMFRIRLTEAPWIGLRRILLAGVVMMNALAAVALILYAALGPLGLFWFLCTWPLTAILGFAAGYIFVPDPKPGEGRTA
jgi:predicted membrane-bound mannosyltransferase